jgi:hypothetical protein
MRIFHGAFIIPLTQVCWTLWTMVSGGVVYGEFTDISTWRIILFVCGAFALFGGVALLAPVYGNKPTSAGPEPSVAISRQCSDQQIATHHTDSNLHKLMNCLSVDELASTNDPKISPIFVHSQTIIFDESLDAAISDPPYLKLRRWRRKRRLAKANQLESVPSGVELCSRSRSRKPSTTLANTPPGAASGAPPEDKSGGPASDAGSNPASVLGNIRV